jgi:ketosteroid isomerase-like protein
MPIANRDLVKKFHAAIESGDIGQISPHLARDVVEVIPYAPHGRPEPFGVFTGKEEVLGYLAGIVRDFSKRVLTDCEYYVADDGDTVFMEAKGDVIQARTGTPYHNVYVFKFTFRDGLITHIAEYANPVTFAKLAGMPLG